MKSGLFEKDDYADVQQKYFADLIMGGRVDADPSGWLLTYSDAEKFFHLPNIRTKDCAKYHIDDGRSLAKFKERIAKLLCRWEDQESISLEEFTLCPSGGCASLVVLATLKGMGIKKVFFETPAYFATIEQAQEIGLQFELLPSYWQDGYALRNVGRKINRSEIALWITQPRAALGFDQSYKVLKHWGRQFGKNCLLVSDEVTDQTFPSHLRHLDHLVPQADVIRIRSFTKGMGLNGLRLAAILHSRKLRSRLVGSLETFGGSIDAHSLLAITKLAQRPDRFELMLNAANAQVNNLRKKAERLVEASPIAINRLCNGYIGSMVADLNALGKSQPERRTRFLQWCKLKRTPVILGNSFYVAKAPPTETIRLNFFNRPEHITKGIANILQLWE